MSSLAKFPDWSVFRERDQVNLGADIEPTSPASELAALLQTYQAARRDMEKYLARERQHWIGMLVRQAILVAQFEMVIARNKALVAQEEQQTAGKSSLQKPLQSFHILKEQMKKELIEAGLRVEIPLGKTYREVENAVTVEGWLYRQEYTQEIVVEVREPVVYFGENPVPVHQGKVVMGGPLQAEDEPPAFHVTQPA